MSARARVLLVACDVEGSLDYFATNLPRAGDRINGLRYVDNSTPWSFSLVMVLPIAPL